MKKYLYDYINFIEKRLAGDGVDWDRLLAYHRVQIGFMQHERLIHLLVTLFFGLLFLISVFAGIIFMQIYWGVLCFILLVVLVFYIWHYFCLENGVQRLYQLDREIIKKFKKL